MTTIAKKVMWVGRATVFTVGLIVTLALILGVGTTALASVPGDPFELGETNTISDALTKLAGTRDGGSMLTVDNNSSASGSRALDLRVESGRAPLNVNADAGRATNLNADELDGKGAEQIGVNGLELVEEDSSTNSDSSKTESADCPDGKVLVGTGYELIGGTSGAVRDLQTDVVVTDVEPSTATESVDVTAFEETPTAAEWLVRASALCATAP
jgi:hypothetical protein